jgi:hypothetical protein
MRAGVGSGAIVRDPATAGARHGSPLSICKGNPANA